MWPSLPAQKGRIGIRSPVHLVALSSTQVLNMLLILVLVSTALSNPKANAARLRHEARRKRITSKTSRRNNEREEERPITMEQYSTQGRTKVEVVRVKRPRQRANAGDS